MKISLKNFHSFLDSVDCQAFFQILNPFKCSDSLVLLDESTFFAQCYKIKILEISDRNEIYLTSSVEKGSFDFPVQISVCLGLILILYCKRFFKLLKLQVFCSEIRKIFYMWSVKKAPRPCEVEIKLKNHHHCYALFAFLFLKKQFNREKEIKWKENIRKTVSLKYLH